MLRHRTIIAIAIISILLIVAGLAIAYGHKNTSRFVTEIRLGRDGSGNAYEHATVTLGRIEDELLDYPPRELLQKYGLADLRSLILVSQHDRSAVLRLRTVAIDRDQKTVEAVHRYLANQIVDSILPRANAERSRIQSEIERLQSNIQAIEKEQAEQRVLRSENESLQAHLRQFGEGLRQELTGQKPRAQPSENGPEKQMNYDLFRDVVMKTIIEAPLQHFSSRVGEARLDQEKAELQAQLRESLSQAEHRQPPAIMHLAVGYKGRLGSPLNYLIWGMRTLGASD